MNPVSIVANENCPRVSFIYYSFSSFVKQDYDILSKHFDIIKVNYRNPIDIFRIIAAVLESDVSFSWFAGGHSFVAILFSKLFRKKSIVIAGGGDVAFVPEINYGSMKKNTRSRFFSNYTLKYADVVLAVSNFTKEEVLKRSSPNNLMVIYNGIDTANFAPSEDKENLVITVGYLSNDFLKRKGFETFIKTADKLPDLKFLLIGKHLDDTIISLKKTVPFNVEFTGYISDKELLKYYQKAKVYCQLSYYESFGMGLAEGMACECVPVVTNRAALPEVVGNTGFLVPYGDPEATVEAIKAALQIDGKAARKRVVTEFDLNKREDKLVEVILKITTH